MLGSIKGAKRANKTFLHCVGILAANGCLRGAKHERGGDHKRTRVRYTKASSDWNWGNQSCNGAAQWDKNVDWFWMTLGGIIAILPLPILNCAAHLKKRDLSLFVLFVPGCTGCFVRIFFRAHKLFTAFVCRLQSVWILSGDLAHRQLKQISGQRSLPRMHRTLWHQLTAHLLTLGGETDWLTRLMPILIIFPS